MSVEWFNDSVDAGYCMPEDAYTVEQGGGVNKGRGLLKGVSRAVPEWVSALEAFRIPDIAGAEFLSGCKVRGHCMGGVHVYMHVAMWVWLGAYGHVRNVCVHSCICVASQRSKKRS